MTPWGKVLILVIAVVWVVGLGFALDNALTRIRALERRVFGREGWL